MIVLHGGDDALQRRLVMVKKQRDGARDFAAERLVVLDQLRANHVCQSQRAVGVALLQDHRIEFARQSRRQNDTLKRAAPSLPSSAVVGS